MIRPLTWPSTDFIFVAAKVRKHQQGITVQTEKVHIRASIENILGAIAVMEIHVQNGNFLIALIEKILRAHGGVINKAITTEVVKGRMMARWPTQAKGMLAVANLLSRGQGDLATGVGGFPSTITDRRFGRKTVIAQLAIDVCGHNLLHASTRPHGGNGFTRLAGVLPLLPAGG